MSELRTLTWAAVVAAAAAIGVSPAMAQEAAEGRAAEAAAAPVASAPDLIDMTVKILELTGTVQHRPSGDAAWQPVAADTVLPLGSQLRTGPRSSIRIQVGANSEVKLESLGVMTIADAAADEADNTLRTRLYKKYGKMTAKVQHVGDLRNDYQIATPGATLAVRGSEVSHTGYETWQVEGIEGSIELLLREESHNIGANDTADTRRSNPNGNAEFASDPNNNTTPNQDTNNQTLTDNYSGLGGNTADITGGTPLALPTSGGGGSGGD